MSHALTSLPESLEAVRQDRRNQKAATKVTGNTCRYCDATNWTDLHPNPVPVHRWYALEAHMHLLRHHA